MIKLKEVRFKEGVKDPRAIGVMTTFVSDDKTLGIYIDGDEVVIHALTQGQRNPDKMEVRVSKHQATYWVFPIAAKAEPTKAKAS